MGGSCQAEAVEVWTTGLSLPRVAAKMAGRAETAGFHGMVLVDSQNLAGDVYVALASAAHATERLALATGVTNPFTRHPAVTAAAIASVHAESGGRAVLGIGRGDSALAHLGRAPARVAQLAEYLATVRAYLHGESVAFDALDPFAGAHPPPPVASLGLAGTPTTSALHWLRRDIAPVPIDVSATGPRVIEVAATHADRVTFGVGADPARLRWAIEQLHAAGGAHVDVGAFVNVVVHDDVDIARRLASGGMSTFARFNVMHGTTAGPMSSDASATLGKLHDAYDMREHTRTGSPQADALDPAFVDRFGIVGPVSHCIERLQELESIGVGRVVVVGPSLGADPTEASAAAKRFTDDVLPNC
jgi:5,10-methylenetetrahydromethanopterin reductase